MAENVNKVIFGGETLIDLSSDTVGPDFLLEGATAHDRSGAIITGTCTFDVDSQDANATSSEILEDRTAYVKGEKIIGTMTNNETYAGNIYTRDENAEIPEGYHDGSGVIRIATLERNKIIPDNIKEGVTILGIAGTLRPTSSIVAQSKTVTPSKTSQVITPDSGIDYLSSVTVNAIPYKETANGTGTMVTIG